MIICINTIQQLSKSQSAMNEFITKSRSDTVLFVFGSVLQSSYKIDMLPSIIPYHTWYSTIRNTTSSICFSIGIYNVIIQDILE
jgi:hypothetical protein